MDMQLENEASRLFDTVPILAGIDPLSKKQLMRCYHVLRVPEKEVIIRQGEIGNKLYVIMRGTVIVKKQNRDGLWHDIAQLHQGDVFGEIAILRQIRRTATVETKTPCVLLSIDAQDFLALYANFPRRTRDNIQLVVAKRLARH